LEDQKQKAKLNPHVKNFFIDIADDATKLRDLVLFTML